jgi:hypothetical protein
MRRYGKGCSGTTQRTTGVGLSLPKLKIAKHFAITITTLAIKRRQNRATPSARPAALQPPGPRPPAGTTPAGQPDYSFRGPLGQLATLTRNQVRFAGTTATVPTLAESTPP